MELNLDHLNSLAFSDFPADNGTGLHAEKQRFQISWPLRTILTCYYVTIGIAITYHMQAAVFSPFFGRLHISLLKKIEFLKK